MSKRYEKDFEDFTTSGSIVNSDKLQIEIDDSSIAKTLEGITVTNSLKKVYIDFDSALTPGEETTLNNIVANHDGRSPDWIPTNFTYWADDPIFTDSRTGKEFPASMMLGLVAERELFNNADSPIYLSSGFTPILGSGGWAEDHASRIGNLETIHGTLGWHQQQVETALYPRPRDLLIYYGYLNSFNSATHGWYNEKVAREMAQYGLLVFGDGLQTIVDSGSHTGSDNASVLTDSSKSFTTDEYVGDYLYNVTDGCIGTITGNTATTVTCSGGFSGGTDNDFDTGDTYRIVSHQDYRSTVEIIERIKVLNPSALIFGYVTTDQSLSDFESKADDWDTLGVDGIFMDESGYDYGRTRAEFNDRVDHVHGLTNATIAFANAWNSDHILGTANDTSYPNTTYNSGEVESSLTSSDWVLLESFAVNDAAYSSNGGYATKSEWAARGAKAVSLRAQYGTKFAAVGIIADSSGSGQDLFDFAFVSACMFSLDASGTSHTSYGSSGATKWWARPDVSNMGSIWSINPSVQVDALDSDVYWRFVQNGKFSVDHSASAQDSSITKY